MRHGSASSSVVSSGSLPLTSGTATRAVFELTLTFPRYSRIGDYPITLRLCDTAGNSRTYSPTDLAGRGEPSVVTVNSK
jgi:hypothetical protein